MQDREISAELPPVLKRAVYAHVARFVGYTAAVFSVMYFIPQLVEVRGEHLFAEHHLTEWLQFGNLALVTLLLFVASWRMRSYRELLLVLASWTGFAMIREKDAMLDEWVPYVGWKIGILLPALVFLYVLMRWRVYKPQLRRFLFTPAFVLFWMGAIIAVPIAQMFGNSELLIDLMGDHFKSSYKRFIEEVGESVGYLVLLMAGIECLVNLRSPIGVNDLPEV